MAVEPFRVEGLAGVLKTLREIGPAASQRGGPVRAVLRKAAVVLQLEVKAQLERVIREPNAGDFPEVSSGLLGQNIVVTRSKPRPGTKGERMLVRIRNKAYPQRGKKPRSTAQIARLLEYGTEKMQPPHPFIRPAFDLKKQEAVDVFVRELPRAIVALQKRLARKNGVKV